MMTQKKANPVDCMTLSVFIWHIMKTRKSVPLEWERHAYAQVLIHLNEASCRDKDRETTRLLDGIFSCRLGMKAIQEAETMASAEYTMRYLDLVGDDEQDMLSLYEEGRKIWKDINVPWKYLGYPWNQDEYDYVEV